MRKAAILAILAIFFAGFVFSVVRMENLRANGADALFPLAPVDPRALLMGDYMALDFMVNRAISQALHEKHGETFRKKANNPMSGTAVISAAKPAGDNNDIAFAAFVRLDDGTPLAPGELRLAFKVRNRGVRTVSSAFYFQEGTAAAYEQARFGRVKVEGYGKTLLLALCDKDGRDIHPKGRGKEENNDSNRRENN